MTREEMLRLREDARRELHSRYQYLAEHSFIQGAIWQAERDKIERPEVTALATCAYDLYTSITNSPGSEIDEELRLLKAALDEYRKARE